MLVEVEILPVGSRDVRRHSRSVQVSVDVVEVRVPVAFLVESVNPDDVGQAEEDVVVVVDQLSVVLGPPEHSGSSEHHQGVDVVV